MNSQLAWEGQYERGQVKQTFVDPEQLKKLQAVIPLLDKAEGEAVAGPNVSIKVNGKELLAVRDGKVVTNTLSPQVKQQLMGISLEVGNEAQSTRTSGDPVTQKPSLVAFQQQQERRSDLHQMAQVQEMKQFAINKGVTEKGGGLVCEASGIRLVYHPEQSLALYNKDNKQLLYHNEKNQRTKVHSPHFSQTFQTLKELKEKETQPETSRAKTSQPERD